MAFANWSVSGLCPSTTGHRLLTRLSINVSAVCSLARHAFANLTFHIYNEKSVSKHPPGEGELPLTSHK